MSDLVIVGSVAGAFGVKGEIRLKSYCANPQDIEVYDLVSEDGTREFKVELTGSTKNGFTARITGVTTKDQADALKGTQLCAERSKLPDLPDDEFYYNDLIGLEVLDTGGAALGKVKNVVNHGAGDILEITAPGASTPILLPFTKVNIPTVDVVAGRIIADPPEGSL